MDVNNGSYVGDAFKYDPEYQRTADYIGMGRDDREDIDTANKLSFVKEWTKGKTLEESLQKMYDLRRRLGTQTVGRTLVNEMYHYLRLTPPKAKPAVKKQANPMGAIEKAIQKVVTSTLKSAMKGNI